MYPVNAAVEPLLHGAAPFQEKLLPKAFKLLRPVSGERRLDAEEFGVVLLDEK